MKRSYGVNWFSSHGPCMMDHGFCAYIISPLLLEDVHFYKHIYINARNNIFCSLIFTIYCVYAKGQSIRNTSNWQYAKCPGILYILVH